MWLDSKAVNCPQKWGNFTLNRPAVLTSRVDSVVGLSQASIVLAVVLYSWLGLLPRYRKRSRKREREVDPISWTVWRRF